MERSKSGLFRASLVAGVLLGCGGNNSYQYTQAALGLGATVAATGIYRATTGGCWAACTPGFACERKSGLCRRSECIPACSNTQTCVIEEDDRFRCIEMLGAGPLTATTPASIANASTASSAAPVSSAAGPASSAVPASSAAPASSGVPPLSSLLPN